MKVLNINAYDTAGGAARAAYRIHHALRDADVASTMVVNAATSGDWTVSGPTSRFEKIVKKIRPQLGALPNSLLNTGNPIIHSSSFLPSGRIEAINTSDADVAHLHWVQNEMLSISDIGRITKPLVWTLHDMWAFCGAEHYSEDDRWRGGYHGWNRPKHESGFDLNRWVWRRKCKHWRNPRQIVTPSRWLAQCVRESALMREWPVQVIPNAIDTNRWAPIDQLIARELLGLPKEVPTIIFGAMGGSSDPRKGFDLLRSALNHLRLEIAEMQIVVFGQLAPPQPIDLGFPIHYAGHLYDDLSLRLLYSAADLLVIPSRQDNLPNTGVEAMSCGTPVVAFNTCGLPDIIDDRRSGYLAKALDTEDLANGIQWVLSHTNPASLRAVSRDQAVRRFSYQVVAKQYVSVYQKLCESQLTV